MTNDPHTMSLDMSVVTDPDVTDALPQLLTEWRARKQWDTMSVPARDLHLAILKAFLNHGQPPKVDPQDKALLNDLEARDLIVMDDETIRHAYPFSNSNMPHSVTIAGITNHTVCAIDAFGASAMVGLPGEVRFDCGACGDCVSVKIGDQGLTLLEAEPQDARIWAGIVEDGGCAASSQCQSMIGFCSEAHLESWRGQQSGDTVGFSFSAAQALQAGSATFRPFMARDAKPILQPSE